MFLKVRFSLAVRVLLSAGVFLFCVNLCVTPSGANIQSLPAPGTMVQLSPAFQPVLVDGIRIYPNNPLKFDFIMD